MSMVDAAPKEVGGRVLRVRVLNRFKTAVSLVAARGADVQRDADGRREVVLEEADAGGERWILPGMPSRSSLLLLCASH